MVGLLSEDCSVDGTLDYRLSIRCSSGNLVTRVMSMRMIIIMMTMKLRDGRYKHVATFHLMLRKARNTLRHAGVD